MENVSFSIAFLVSVARLELARLATMDSKSILSTIPTHRLLYATVDLSHFFVFNYLNLGEYFFFSGSVAFFSGIALSILLTPLMMKNAVEAINA